MALGPLANPKSNWTVRLQCQQLDSHCPAWSRAPHKNPAPFLTLPLCSSHTICILLFSNPKPSNQDACKMPATQYAKQGHFGHLGWDSYSEDIKALITTVNVTGNTVERVNCVTWGHQRHRRCLWGGRWGQPTWAQCLRPLHTECSFLPLRAQKTRHLPLCPRPSSNSSRTNPPRSCPRALLPVNCSHSKH